MSLKSSHGHGGHGGHDGDVDHDGDADNYADCEDDVKDCKVIRKQ